jgi:hypothetical protein
LQQVREQKRRQVVGSERLLDAIDAAFTLVENAAGVVEQHVDPVIREVDVSGHVANLLLGGQIGDEQLRRGARSALSDPGSCRLATPWIATDHHDLGSRFGGPLGRYESDAAVGTGHYDGLVVHVNHVLLRICGCRLLDHTVCG